jgi:hypothetical protein
MITAALTSYALCMAETSTTQMAPAAAPTLRQITGNVAATLEPSRYPKFVSFTISTSAVEKDIRKKYPPKQLVVGSKEDQARIKEENDENEDRIQKEISATIERIGVCNVYLTEDFTGSDPEGTAQPGMSLSPVWFKSRYGNGTTILSADPGYAPVPELEITGFSIPERYKNSSKILITWTVRVEGNAPETYVPRPSLCGEGVWLWRGTSKQRFPGGQVHTRLYVNDKPLGQEAALSMPEAGEFTADPTITGSCLLSKEDFNGGAFPDTMNIEVRWYNDTSMKIKSPAKMRSLSITTLPITKQ